MTQVLIGILATTLFIGLVVIGYSYYDPSAMSGKVLEAHALRLVSERSQIEAAVDQFIREEGRLPVAAGQTPIEVLIAGRYLRGMPPGGGSGWHLMIGYGSIMTEVDPSRPMPERLRMCALARERMGIADPDRIYRCDGTDHPAGRLAADDPCCLGQRMS